MHNKKKRFSISAIIWGLTYIGSSLAIALTTGAMFSFLPALGVFFMFFLGYGLLCNHTENTSKYTYLAITILTSIALIAAGITVVALSALPTLGLSVLMGIILSGIGLQIVMPKPTGKVIGALISIFGGAISLALIGFAIAVLATTTGVALLTFWPTFVFMLAFLLSFEIFGTTTAQTQTPKITAIIEFIATVSSIGTIITLAATGILPTFGMLMLISIPLGIMALTTMGSACDNLNKPNNEPGQTNSEHVPEPKPTATLVEGVAGFV
jgi:hypothetical protein